MITETESLPKPLLLLIALIQGLLLLALHQAIRYEFWPDSDPPWLFALYTLVIVAPLMVLLSLEQGSQWRTILRWVAPFALLGAALGYYAGRQLPPPPWTSGSTEDVLLLLLPTMAVATFKALMYAQQRASGERFAYSQLFRLSWRNFLTLGLALLFTLAVWGILMLWAALFNVINIRFFADLFGAAWFYYPALALAFGCGVIIFRSQSRVIDTITRIQQALMKFLLVFLVLVSMLFLAALPFTGLAPLWRTGSGSTLILAMQGMMLFFLNAVYQDEPENRPYSLWLHRFIYAGIALLPIYSVIVAYGLWLRIDQYGFTPARCWGVLIWALFALFSVGYLWGIVRQRDDWLWHLSWINVRMGLAVLALMLLVNSPLLDFRKITVASQMNRFAAGDITAENLDLVYFRYSLAKPGYDALQTLKATLADTHPEVVATIDTLYTSRSMAHGVPDRDTVLASISRVGSHSSPSGLDDAIYQYLAENAWYLAAGGRLILLPVDLDGNGQGDYVLFIERPDYRYPILFHRTLDGWQHQTMARSAGIARSGNNLRDLLEQGKWRVVRPRWQYLDIDGEVFHVMGGEVENGGSARYAQ